MVRIAFADMLGTRSVERRSARRHLHAAVKVRNPVHPRHEKHDFVGICRSRPRDRTGAGEMHDRSRGKWRRGAGPFFPMMVAGRDRRLSILDDIATHFGEHRREFLGSGENAAGYHGALEGDKRGLDAGRNRAVQDWSNYKLKPSRATAVPFLHNPSGSATAPTVCGRGDRESPFGPRTPRPLGRLRFRHAASAYRFALSITRTGIFKWLRPGGTHCRRRVR